MSEKMFGQPQKKLIAYADVGLKIDKPDPLKDSQQ
jgi:hypothetical protein